MIRKAFLAILMLLSITAIVYGGFFRKFLVYDNLVKFDMLKKVGITIKVPGYEQKGKQFTAQSQQFTEPEIVNAATFDGVSRYKDGRLMSNFPNLKDLRGRRPCPS
jgi:hypothetical protein